MRTRFWLCIGLALTILSAGCGRKGPLFLPDETRRPPSTERQDQAPQTPSSTSSPGTK